MSEATLLESRVDKIERDNRRLKLTVGALLLALAAVPLIGAVMPEQIPELIQAREFQVIDENGNLRAWMGNRGFLYNDENGTSRVGMGNNGFVILDENGIGRVRISDRGFQYYAENSNTRALIGDCGFSYYDENGDIVWSTDCAPNF